MRAYTCHSALSKRASSRTSSSTSGSSLAPRRTWARTSPSRRARRITFSSLLLAPPHSSLAPRSLLLAPRSWPARCPTQVEMDGQGQPTAKRAALAGGGPVAGGPAAGSSLYKGFALRRDFRVYKQIMGRQGRRSGNPLRNNVAPRASGVPGALGASSALPRFTGATERLLFVRRSSCRPRCFVRSTSSL